MRSCSRPRLMAPSHLLHHPPTNVCPSKARVSLARIIAIISTVPPLPHLQPNAPRGFRQKRIDLNLRLGPPQEIHGGAAEEKKSGALGVHSLSESGDASTVEKAPEGVTAVANSSITPAELPAQQVSTAGNSSEGECDPEEIPAESQKEVSGITNAPWKPEEEEEEEEARGKEEQEQQGKERKKRGNRGEGCLDLLLEAVRQVSGGLFDDDKHGNKDEDEGEAKTPSAAAEEIRPKRRRMWWEASTALRCLYGEEEESAPVVRSKRGRSQVLPSRFRDSVLEPWAKVPSSSVLGLGLGGRSAGQRHRSSR